MLFAVYAVYDDRNRFLGCVECDSIKESQKDIESFFEDQKGYRLEIEEIKPIRIAKGYAERKKSLIKRREDLERQLQLLKTEGLDLK